MAHKEQQEFVDVVRRNFNFYFGGKRVLDVGSLILCGSLRDFFVNCDYIGIDIAPGWGVDIVCQGQDYAEPDNSFDVVCSAECFEHNPFWDKTFDNMIRLCKPGGLVFFTCATTGRKEHGTARSEPTSSPLTVDAGWEYYRNLTEADFRARMDFNKLFSYYGFQTNDTTHDLYFWGIKR